MFVKHITDEDIFRAGFLLNPVFNETFYKEKIDTTYISTYMQIWVDANSYQYKVVTDREGEVERGTIFSAAVLKDLSEEYFNKDVQTFLKRQLNSNSENLNPVEGAFFKSLSKKVDQMNVEVQKSTMLNLFGESYA